MMPADGLDRLRVFDAVLLGAGGCPPRCWSTQRKTPQGQHDGDLLMADIVALAQQYGRYGYRRIMT